MSVRKNFGKLHDIVQPPDLIATQTQSYSDFLQLDAAPNRRRKTGLQAVFKEIFPVESYDGQCRLDFVKYEIKPLVEIAEKPEVAEICSMLGRGKIKQSTAQLAAWHLNNGMSWREIAGIRHKLGFTSKPVYTSVEVAAAKKAVDKATKAVKKRATTAEKQSESQNTVSGS